MADTWTNIAVTEHRTPDGMARTWTAAGPLGLLRVEDIYRALYPAGEEGRGEYALDERLAWLNGYPVFGTAATRALADSAGLGGPPLLVIT